MVKRVKPVPERTEPERTLILVTNADNQVAISNPKATLQSTPMPYPAIATASQEIPATLVTTKTLLLLTFGPKFDKTTTYVDFEPA